MSQTQTLISGGTLIDGTGAEPFSADVLIKGNRIVAVGPATAISVLINPTVTMSYFSTGAMAWRHLSRE